VLDLPQVGASAVPSTGDVSNVQEADGLYREALAAPEAHG
jgi:hypothetical protein